MLKNKVISSVKWLGLLRYASRSLDFIKILILARILSPVDFGLLALATTTINTLEALTDTGFNYAFIQLQEDMKKFAKTLWIVSIVRGIILSLMALVLSSFLSSFFHTPSLLWFLVIGSMIPLVKGFQNPYVILFQKNLNFHLEFTFRFIPSFIQTVLSVILVIYFKNPIWLVVSILVGIIFETIFSFILTTCNFSEPFSKKLVGKLFDFGKSLTITSLFTFIMTQIDNIFVGRVFGAYTLGLYDVMFKLANLAFSEITDIISRVAFPFFASIQQDRHRLKQAYLKNLIIVSIPAFIITALMILFPLQILTLLLGGKWISGAHLLQILAIYGFFRACAGAAGPLFLSIGKPHVLTVTSTTNFILAAILIYPLALMWGVNGVAWAMVISYVLSLCYLFYHVSAFLKK